MATRRIVYKNEQHMFTVSEDDGQLVLEALCGRSGIRVEEHWLNDRERALFNRLPEGLAPLAASLCDRT